MKKGKLISLCLSILLVLGCTKQNTINTESTINTETIDVLQKGSSVKLLVATDIHYLSQDIVVEGNKFKNMYLNNDGKMVNYIEQITDAFIEEVISQKPSALIISGDLTFNGEKKSHEDLANKLQRVKDRDIPVLVIPGNHDISNYGAMGYKENSVYPVEHITMEEFKNIYGRFSYNSAIDRDKNSLSYISAISEDLWVFMVDTSKYNSNSKYKPSTVEGEVNKDTYVWLEKALEKAKNCGVTPIMVTHHNLLKHNEHIYKGYTIDNSNEVVNLFNKYNVKINFSGHGHLQHIAKNEANENILYDIQNSSLSVYNSQYGIVEFTPNKGIDYYTKSLEIEEWAKARDSNDENLLIFNKYSQSFLMTNIYNKTINALEGIGLSDKEKGLIANTVAEINSSYFSGQLNSSYKNILESEGYKLIIGMENVSVKKYIESFLNGPLKEENKISINL